MLTPSLSPPSKANRGGVFNTFNQNPMNHPTKSGQRYTTPNMLHLTAKGFSTWDGTMYNTYAEAKKRHRGTIYVINIEYEGPTKYEECKLID